MSSSMYRNQVDRLTDEIARLRAKEADEAGKAAKDRSDALRISNSISKSTSPSTLSSKLKDIQRKEESAAQHDKRSAQYAKDIAGKQRSLTNGQNSLTRALDQDRKKEEREDKKRRDEELRHLRALEARRRSLQEPIDIPQSLAPSVRVAPQPPSREAADFEYDVCLSFAGEERSYVEMVAGGLKEHGVRVFYDDDETVKLWGKDLAEHLDYIYRKASRYCVMFVSEAYARKPWTRHERRSALARALEEESEYILPARFDDTDLDGLPPTIGYLDLQQYAPATLVDFLLEKLGITPKGDSEGDGQENGS
ncbi:MAG TPA: TIR domain-containing protein [Actinomycetota bacterium]|nr:TIR domain-containing protein [Actinomycetota bacterium]